MSELSPLLCFGTSLSGVSAVGRGWRGWRAGVWVVVATAFFSSWATLFGAETSPNAPASARFQGPSTARMAERLKGIAAQADPRKTPFLSAARAEGLRAFLASQPPGQMPLDVVATYGRELLN